MSETHQNTEVKNSGQGAFAAVLVTIAAVVVIYFIVQATQTPVTNQAPVTTSTTTEQSSVSAPIKSKQQTAPPPPSRPRYYTPMTFPQNVESNRTSYVNGCMTTGGNSSYCNCSFDYLISNYGLVWLIEANANYNAQGIIPREFSVAAQYCSVWNN